MRKLMKLSVIGAASVAGLVFSVHGALAAPAAVTHSKVVHALAWTGGQCATAGCLLTAAAEYYPGAKPAWMIEQEQQPGAEHVGE